MVLRTPGKPGTPGILLEFHFPTWKTLITWNFAEILLEFLSSVDHHLTISNVYNAIAGREVPFKKSELGYPY